MAQEATFKCLRCGHEFKMPFDPQAPMIERACPKCLSNSVRRQKAEGRAEEVDSVLDGLV